VIGTRVIGTKRGVQWDRWKMRVSWKGLGPRGKKKIKSEGYYCEQNEDMDSMD
jgi:hypothetical protein